MSELRSAVDALAADDLHGLVDGQLLDRTAELVQSINRLSAELTRTVRHADVVGAAEHDGLRTMQSLLRGHHHVSAPAALVLTPLQKQTSSSSPSSSSHPAHKPPLPPPTP